jgi:hypothetical protein
LLSYSVHMLTAERMASGGESELGDFGRTFPKPWLNILKERPAWWQDVLDCRFRDVSGTEQPLFLAIRNGYLNAYVEGQSLLKVQFDGSALKAQIHHKYISDDAEGQEYKVFDGVAVGDMTYTGKAMLSQWVTRAQKYAKPSGNSPAISEKQGVAVIASRNPHVIDVEMGLPGQVADRIDIVALERAGSAINIVFYEAKLFNNGALRARSFPPKVLEQLGRYETWLTKENREDEVTQAYRKTCKLLIELRMMQGANSVHDLIVDASKDGSNLRIDPKPRLIVFGYDESRAGHYWKPHEEALRVRAGLGDRGFLMQPRPEDVRIPEDTHREGWIDAADDILLDVEGPQAVTEVRVAARRNKLLAIARFAAIFSDPKFQFGIWHEPPPVKAGVFEMPYCALTLDAGEFVQAAYDAGWVKSFDWSSWVNTPEAQELNNSTSYISAASEEQISKLLTAHIRSDRFCDGALQSAFESGVLTAIVRRAEALLEEDQTRK